MIRVHHRKYIIKKILNISHLQTTSNMPLYPRDNLKDAKYFPPQKSRSMSKQRTPVLCFSNFLTHSPLFTGLDVELKAVNETKKYIIAGLA